jgi:hypothetical protein
MPQHAVTKIPTDDSGAPKQRTVKNGKIDITDYLNPVLPRPHHAQRKQAIRHQPRHRD